MQAQLVNQGLNLCEQWQNLVYAIDPPYGQNVAGVLSFKPASESGDPGRLIETQPDGSVFEIGRVTVFCPFTCVIPVVTVVQLIGGARLAVDCRR